MARPVPEVVLQTVLVISQGRTWQCAALLEDEGPHAGSYLGLAVEQESLDTLLTPPMARMLDALYSVVRMAINQDCPIRTPADDVRVSRGHALESGFKNPL